MRSREIRRLSALRLGALEMTRFSRGRLPRAGLAALVLLPLLYGALYLWSFWDPYGNTDKLPVALVNEDRPVTVGGEEIRAGADLVEELEERQVFAWVPVSAAEADHGLTHGDYYMTLTIPADFSKNLASSHGSRPENAALKVATNDSNSYLSGIIARSVFKEIRAAGSAEASRGYYDKIYVAFSNLHKQTKMAADSVGGVASGTAELRKGSAGLHHGLKGAKEGSSSLATGLDTALTGSNDLAGGLARLHSGVTTAASGTARIHKVVHDRADNLVPLLRTRSDDIKSDAEAVAKAAAAVRSSVHQLPGTAAEARADAAVAAARLDNIYARQCSAGGANVRPARSISENRGASVTRGSSEGHGSAQVRGSAVGHGSAQVHGSAVGHGSAQVRGSAVGHGSAKAHGSSEVGGSSEVHGSAKAHGSSEIHGSAKVRGSAEGHGSAKAHGSSEVHGSAKAHGSSEIHGSAKSQGFSEDSGSSEVRVSAEVHGSAEVLGSSEIHGSPKAHGSPKTRKGSETRKAATRRAAETRKAANHRADRTVAAPPAAVPCGVLKNARDAADQAAYAAMRVDTVVSDRDNLNRIATAAGTVQTYAAELAKDAPYLADNVSAALARIDQLNAGLQTLANGSGNLLDGANGLHSGLTRLSTGADALDGGIYKLSTGAGTLNSGLGELADGTSKLADGLSDGADRIPNYSKSERDQRTKVMSDPVKLALQTLNKAANYGTGFAPYFLPLALWVGMMVGYMLLRPLNSRLLSANTSALRVWLAGYVPALALAVPQILVLMAVLHLGLGLRMVHPLGVLAFLLLTSASFAAVLQFLNARFGPAARILGLAMLMVQLTSAGGTYPVQTSPGFFNAVHPWLPMTWSVQALRRLISGGDMSVVWQACTVLAAFLVGSCALTVLTARTRQVWTLSRLHPELTL